MHMWLLDLPPSHFRDCRGGGVFIAQQKTNRRKSAAYRVCTQRSTQTLAAGHAPANDCTQLHVQYMLNYEISPVDVALR